jgi:hypothetical protein
MEHAGHEWEVAAALGCLGSRDRHRAIRSPVERAQERDDALPAGGGTSQLHGGFDRLGTRVGQKHLPWFALGHGGGQLFGDVDHLFVDKVRAGHVDKFVHLVVHGLDDFGMGVTGRYHRDTGGHV